MNDIVMQLNERTPGSGENTGNDSSELGPWGNSSDAGGDPNDKRVGSR